MQIFIHGRVHPLISFLRKHPPPLPGWHMPRAVSTVLDVEPVHHVDRMICTCTTIPPSSAHWRLRIG